MVDCRFIWIFIFIIDVRSLDFKTHIYFKMYLKYMQIYIWIGLFISFLWGIQTVIHKHLLNHISGLSIMIYSAILYTLLLCILAYYQKSIIIKDLKKIDLRISSILFFTAFFTVFLTNILYYYILNHHESGLVSALISTAPIFTVIFAYLFLKEKLSIYGFMGIVFFILGLILINMDNTEKEYFSHN